MKQPLVSIVLPTYNGKSEWLSMAVDSVISQSYPNWELIIINDASTNDIEKTILSYTHKDERIKYLNNEKNRERSYSKNRGIMESRGKYIAFIDDDDFWSDCNKLEQQIDFLEKNEDYGLCGCSVISIDDEGKKTIIIVRETYTEIKNNILKRNQIAQSSVVLRKEILLCSGLYNTDFISSEDYDMWLRIGRFSKLHNLPNVFFTYRDRAGNSSHKQRIIQHINGFIAMRNNKIYYSGFFKAFFLRIGYFILVLFKIKK